MTDRNEGMILVKRLLAWADNSGSLTARQAAQRITDLEGEIERIRDHAKKWVTEADELDRTSGDWPHGTDRSKAAITSMVLRSCAVDLDARQALASRALADQYEEPLP